MAPLCPPRPTAKATELGLRQRWRARRARAERGRRQSWSIGPGGGAWSAAAVDAACQYALHGCGSGKSTYAAAGPNEAAALIARGSCGRCELTSHGRRERRTTRLANGGSSGGRRAPRASCAAAAAAAVAASSRRRADLKGGRRDWPAARAAAAAAASSRRRADANSGRRGGWPRRREAQDAARWLTLHARQLLGGVCPNMICTAIRAGYGSTRVRSSVVDCVVS